MRCTNECKLRPKKSAARLCPPTGLRYFCTIMRKILLFIALLTTALAGRAESIDTLFHRAPEDVLPMLEGNTRLDLLDLYNYKMEAKAENIFGGTARLTHKTPDYLHVSLTNASEWEMKLLATNKDTLICVIHTRRAPAARSTIRMFRKNWQPAASTLPQPAPADFVAAGDTTDHDERTDILARLSTHFTEAHWNNSTCTLILRLSTEALNDTMRTKAEALLRPLHYRWEDGHFAPTTPTAQ